MRLHFPTTIEEAVALKKETKGAYIAGGTVLMVNKYNGKPVPEDFISLERIPELHTITEDETSIRVGAACSFSEIEENASIATYCRALQMASSQIGGPQIRNRGTIGGNFACHSPASDSVAPILVLNPAVLMKEDLVTAFVFRKEEGLFSTFRKVGKRSALAVSSVSIALSRDRNGVVRVAVGSAAPQVRLCSKTSALLSSGGSLSEAKDLLMTEIAPIDDRWGSAEYRRAVLRNLLEELYREVQA